MYWWMVPAECVFVEGIHLSVGGWKEVRSFFRWVGWPVAWWWSSRVVQVASNNNTSFSLLTLHSCATTSPWHRGWLMTSLYSCFLFISIQHTCSPHFSTISLCTCQLTDNSLYSSTVYILAHNVLLASPGRAQKSKQNHNKLLRCSLHDFPISSPFLLTCPQLHTHSLPGISLAAWPIRFSDQ